MPLLRTPSLLLVVALGACIDANPRQDADSNGPDTSATTAPADTTTRPDTTPPEETTEPDSSGCTGCFIDGSCYAHDELNPRNPCLKCAATEPDRWALVADGTGCDDGLTCTSSGHCQEGVCDVDIEPDTCVIDGACRPAGADPSDRCFVCDPSYSTTEWLEPGCSDDLVCTLDVCEDDGCRSSLSGGWCLIADTCFEAEQPKPGNVCKVCDPSENHEDWTVADGASCDDGDVCTDDDRCREGGACRGELVKYGHEPNDSALTARNLGNNVATYPAGGESANLNPGTDVDWFTWRMPVVADGVERKPRAALEVNGDQAMRLCVYATCGESVADFVPPTTVCPPGATPSVDGELRAGCCVTSDDKSKLDVALDVTCPLQATLNTPGIAYARVSFGDNGAVSDSMCINYNLSWGADE